jgi:transcriptional regulator with XRE-family HTH domain
MRALHPIKIYRSHHGLTQVALAEALDVKRETVARWEGGTRKVDQDLLPTVSRLTGIPKRVLRPDLVEVVADEPAGAE